MGATNTRKHVRTGRQHQDRENAMQKTLRPQHPLLPIWARARLHEYGLSFEAALAIPHIRSAMEGARKAHDIAMQKIARNRAPYTD